MLGKIKPKCDECKKRYRKLRKYHDKQLCFTCHRKKYHLVYTKNYIKPMEKLLNKTYEVKGYISSNGNIKALCSFPSALIGYKLKVIK